MKILYIAMGLMMLNGLSAQAQDTSCGILWDAPILLSDTNYNAHSPKIALSGDDTVHIVWSNSSFTIRLPYMKSSDGGKSFGPRVELLPDSVNFPIRANGPKIVAWHQSVYVFFQGGSPGIFLPIRMVKSIDAGNSWSYPVDISPDTSGPPPLTPSILGDTIVMSYVREGQVPHKILRSTDAGQSWEGVNAGLPNSHSLSLGARFAPSPGGVLHLVQIAVVGGFPWGETEYRRSDDLGDTWVQQSVLSTIDPFGSLDPTIAASTRPGDATVITAWRDPKYGCIGLVGCSIIARRGMSGQDSTTWNPEQVLTDIPAGYEPSLSVHNMRVAAAWPMDQETTPFAEVRVSNDTSWCSSVDPTTGIQTRAVSTIAVALSSKALHVVWFASQAPDPSTFRIFYRRGVFTTTSVAEKPRVLPDNIHLAQNYPNPFHPMTNVEFRIPNAAHVSLRVYDLLGREVAVLVNEKKEPSEHTVEWDAGKLPSGVYYYRIIAGDRIETKKAILIR